MKYKITKDLSNLKIIVPQVKADFVRTAQRPIHVAIVRSILRGVSPVKGKRFPKYSASYKEQIRGKATYFKKGGKVIRVPAKKGKLSNKVTKTGKRISPVNLKLTGKLLRSYFSEIHGIGNNINMLIGFKHFLAEIHDKKGASVKKVIRRMLPHTGERFNKQIEDTIKAALKKSVSVVAKKISLQ